MARNFHRESLIGVPQHSSAKRGVFFRSKFFRFSLPILGGIIIGLLAALMMKFAGK